MELKTEDSEMETEDSELEAEDSNMVAEVDRDVGRHNKVDSDFIGPKEKPLNQRLSDVSGNSI